MPIMGYSDFLQALNDAGFSMAGGKRDAVYSILSWGWGEDAPYETPVSWFSGDAETDPWEWRIRVLDEKQGISYGKVFFRTAGFITRAWAPRFLAVRRGRQTFAEAYQAGVISHYAKRIYEAIEANGEMPVHILKPVIGFVREDKSAFDRALVDLQMKMYITTSGSQQRISEKGEPYSWPSSSFCTTEAFWGDAVCNRAANLDPKAAEAEIAERVFALNPKADAKKVLRFIRG